MNQQDMKDLRTLARLAELGQNEQSKALGEAALTMLQEGTEASFDRHVGGSLVASSKLRLLAQEVRRQTGED